MYSGEPACTAHVGDGRPRPSGLSEARRCCKKEFSINNWENSRLHGFGKRMTSNRAAAQPLRLRSAHSRLEVTVSKLASLHSILGYTALTFSKFSQGSAKWLSGCLKWYP